MNPQHIRPTDFYRWAKLMLGDNFCPAEKLAIGLVLWYNEEAANNLFYIIGGILKQ